MSRFSVYRQPPKKADLEAFVGRFAPQDEGLVTKILDAVVIVSELEIQQCYKSLLEGIPGWAREGRQGRWFFVGAGNAGESGQAMLRPFREANNLTNDRWQGLFASMRELPSLRLSARDTVIFVDDFAGSGTQMTDYWPTMQELLASEARCFLMLTAATEDAVSKIGTETDLELRVCIRLGPEHNVFSEHSTLLTEGERVALASYGEIAWGDYPKGYKDGGLLFVLSHKTPNNSVPVLHANHVGWTGPFPRNLLQS